MTTTEPTPSMNEETLLPFKTGPVPQTVEALWADFDPRREPLDVEILKEWEEDGVVLQVLRYRIGIFKGQKSMMAGVYGYPKGGSNLPGLVQTHGGGQYANYQAPLTNAKRGYATISLSWGGRIDAPDYMVHPDEVKLFWEGKTDDPNYKVITNWGALDAYHHPSRNPETWSQHSKPEAWTLDEVDSPRNGPWFLCTVAARRALTFLEQQPEVDGDRLGVYGHSMGGKITVMTAGCDDRVKAAAPSCGGISHRDDEDPLVRVAISDDAYLQQVSCPIMFLSPANDFHGQIDDLQTALKEIKTDEWRATCAAHHNHQDTAEYEVATQVWMDHYLKGSFTCPQTPPTELKFENGVPVLTVLPDTSRPVLQVDVFYTQHGQVDGRPDDRENTGSRFWHYAATDKQGDAWTAELPLPSIDKPLWVYANVLYPLDEPVTGAGYYYRVYTTDRFNLSSTMHQVSADELQAAGVKAAMEPSLVIESFEGDWEKEWFTYRPEEWGRHTNKPYSEVWRAPDGARLAVDVRAAEPNKLVIGLDNTAAEIALPGGPEWQSIVLSPEDFRNAAGTPRADWKGIKLLRLVHQDRLCEQVDGEDQVQELGGEWKGAAPIFRNLRWVV